jgi:hypothetical protein
MTEATEDGVAFDRFLDASTSAVAQVARTWLRAAIAAQIAHRVQPARD